MTVVLGLAPLWSAAQSCPAASQGDPNQQLVALLDFIAVRVGTDVLRVAECASDIYRNANLSGFHEAFPARTERLVQDVTAVQRRAAEKLQEQGDVDASLRFLRLEITLRKKVLEDLAALPPQTRERFFLERVRQITYLIQGLERSGDGEEIDRFLTSADYEYFQPQVVNAWLRSLYSCPDWRELSKVDALTDAQLRQGVCRPACTPRAKAAIDNIEAWRSRYRSEWQKSVVIRSLHGRLAAAVKSCRADEGPR